MKTFHFLHPARLQDLGIRGIFSANFTIYCLLLLPFVENFVDAATSFDKDNVIVGSPIVECERDFIRFKVPTKKPFRGKVYVKGEFSNPNCVHSYTDADYDKLKGKANQGRKKNSQNETPTYAQKVGKSDEREFGEGSATNYAAKSAIDNLRAHPDLGPPSEAEFYPEDVTDERRSSASSSVTIFERRKINSKNQPPVQRTILGESGNGNLPGFSTSKQNTNWRSFLRGRPNAADGSSFLRSGSRVTPNSNGECPLQCPPCSECIENRHSDDPLGDEPTLSSSGRAFVYNNEEEKSLHKRELNSRNSAELEVQLGTCNTRRDRIASPPGIHVSFTVVVSFHNNFITQFDRAYHIECAYEESDRNVQMQIDVSQPPIIELNGVVESPQCHYHIRMINDGSFSDASALSVTNVRVGDNVRHEWICQKSTSSSTNNESDTTDSNKNEKSVHRLHKIFGLLIHDCYVDDGQGRKELMIDDHGCSVSPLVLPTPSYSEKQLSANVESLVVKFPDRDLLGFQCAITICMRELGQCDGITPPKCNTPSKANRTRRFIRDENGKFTFISNWQLHAPTLTVFDADEKHASEFYKILSAASHSHLPQVNKPLNSKMGSHAELKKHNICVSVPAFGILVASATFLTTISAATLFVIVFLWKPPSNEAKRLLLQKKY